MALANDHFPAQTGDTHRHPKVGEAALTQMPPETFRTRRRADDDGQVFRVRYHDADMETNAMPVSMTGSGSGGWISEGHPGCLSCGAVNPKAPVAELRPTSIVMTGHFLSPLVYATIVSHKCDASGVGRDISGFGTLTILF